MSDTDRRPLTEAPQMHVHYCEEKGCEEWGGWGNSPSGCGDPLVVLRAFPTQVIRAGTGTQAEAKGGRARRYRSTIAGKVFLHFRRGHARDAREVHQGTEAGTSPKRG